MSITIYGSDYDALWQEANPASQNIKSEGFAETLQLVPKRFGQGYIQLIQLHGIELTLFNYQLHEDLFLIRKGQETTDTHREFGFHLSGNRHGKRTGENFVDWGRFDQPDEYVQIAYDNHPLLKVDIHLESADGLGQSIAEILEELPAETRERICDRSPDPSTSDPSKSANSEFCRLVKHEMGKTEVCGQPQKVAALSPHILDSMLALGVQPAAYAAWVEYKDLKTQTYDNPAEQIPYLGQWVTTKPMVLGDRNSPSLERLALLKPDLILGEHFGNEDEYSFLTQIAPTLLFSDKNADGQQFWQNDIQGIAKALGKEAQAEELLAAWERQIAQARTALQPLLQANPRIFLISTDLTTYINSQPESTTARLLKEIGFEVLKPEGTQGETEISLETLSKIDADIIIVMSRSDEDFCNPEPVLRQKWEENPLLNSMSVFQQGRVFFVDIHLWSSVTRGPLSDQLILEALPDLLLVSVEEKNRA